MSKSLLSNTILYTKYQLRIISKRTYFQNFHKWDFTQKSKEKFQMINSFPSNFASSSRQDKQLSIFMEKQYQKGEKIKERELFTHLQNQSICPGSVAAYHPSLSSLGLGFKFRPGRFSIFTLLTASQIQNQFLIEILGIIW